MVFSYQARLMTGILAAAVGAGVWAGATWARWPFFPPPGPALLSWLGLGLFAALSAYLISRQAVRPLKKTRRKIESFALHNLRDRLYVPEVETEAGKVLLELNALLDRLEEYLARQRQFVSAISHDIRTPLTILKGDIEVALMREREPEEYEEILQSNLEEVERIRRLVEDLVTLARSDYGDLGLNVRTVSLAVLAEEVRESFTEAVKRKGLILESYLRGDVIVEGDQAKLRQLLHNLLSNAVSYTPSGGRIELVLLSDKERHEVEIRLRDTGIGISPQDLPHIFEPFYRGTHSRRIAGHDGYGLGLAICAHIVRAHGGRITVESREGPGPDSGTTFTVHLPRRPRLT